MPGIYIHIPFCVRKCAYCDFVSFEDHARMGAYLAALQKEMALCAPAFSGRVYDTVFFGGGTPSILPSGAAAALMEALRGSFCIRPDAEVTIECNPGTADAAKLAEYRAAGVNRLSFGVQSADDGLLCRIGRIHTFSDFLQSYEQARAAGFSNINADVLYGLPGQTPGLHLATLERVCALGLQHISAYSLILEPGTPLYESGCTLPDEDAAYAMHRNTIEFLEGQGYARYEVSNYAQPGYMCWHNLNYWDNGEYVGLGLNAHSAARLEDSGWTRWSNTADLGAYIAAAGRGELPVLERENIGRQEERFESVMLGLRKTQGIDLARFEARFGACFLSAYPESVLELERRGWLEVAGGFARLTPEGLDMQNQALLLFLEEN